MKGAAELVGGWRHDFIGFAASIAGSQPVFKPPSCAPDGLAHPAPSTAVELATGWSARTGCAAAPCLRQPAVAHLGVSELALDDPEGALDFGPHAGLQVLDLVDEPPEPALVLSGLARTRPPRDLPVHARLGVGGSG